MIFKAINIYDKEVTFINPYSVTLNQEEGVPADDITAIFPISKKPDELVSLIVYDKKNNIVFKGIVDEQNFICSANGLFLKIVARSLAALLLDNEAKPENYTMPPVELIYNRYIKEWQIEKFDLSNDFYFGDFSVSKGETNWQVISRFCQNLYGTVPRITSDGKLMLKGIQNNKHIRLCNTETQAIEDSLKSAYLYTEISENIKRCNVISQVNMKSFKNSGYDTIVENHDAINRKIRCRRYINATLHNVTPAICAYKILEQGKKESYILTVTCPANLVNALGATADIQDKNLGKISDLFVCRVKYSLTKFGEETTITLRKKE